MNGLRYRLNLMVSLFCVAALLLSFGLHAVQINHTHYSAASTHAHEAQSNGHHESNVPDGSIVSLGEEMHLSDKKNLLVVFGFTTYLLLSFSVVLQDLLRSHQSAYALCARQKRFWFNKLFNYLQRFYATGVLNPKLF